MSGQRLLGVNIDHVATIRQVRRETYPNLAHAVRLAEAGGADFITAHLREDRRHIQDADIKTILKTTRTWLNLELSLAPAMLAIGLATKPKTVCLVPEKREELTTEGGLDVAGQLQRVTEAVAQFKDAGIAVSLFIDAENEQIAAAKETGTAAIELHTGAYANCFAYPEAEQEIAKIETGVAHGLDLGLVVNLGHGLNLANVADIAHIRGITEFNIGHAIVADAVFVGLAEAVAKMKAAISP